MMIKCYMLTIIRNILNFANTREIFPMLDKLIIVSHDTANDNIIITTIMIIIIIIIIIITTTTVNNNNNNYYYKDKINNDNQKYER